MTVMMVAHRPLPLLELRNAFLDRQAKFLSRTSSESEENGLTPEMLDLLVNLKKQWTGTSSSLAFLFESIF